MRDLSLPAPNYVVKGWQPGGFRWIRPWSQILRAQNGQIVAGSRNGLHSGEMNLLPAAGPHASRILQSGQAAPSVTLTAQAPGVQATLPLASGQTLYARPSVIGPQ